MYPSPCKDIEKSIGMITVGIGMRLGINGRIIWKLFLRTRIMWCELDSSGSGYGPVASCCEHGNMHTVHSPTDTYLLTYSMEHSPS